MRVETEIQIGEAARAARAVGLRRPMTWAGVIVGVLMGVGAIVLTDWLTSALLGALGLADGVTEVISVAVALALVWWVGLPLWRRVAMAQFRRRLGREGTSGPLAITCEIGPEALTYTAGRLTKIAPWSIVSEVQLAKGWWVIIVQAEATYLPRRAFPSVEAEQAFLAELLGRMDEAARTRSPAAIRAAGPKWQFA